MSEDIMVADDASHYEISLTAGQAFIAFVLLLLSLAASFTFGLMIGKGQSDERLVVKHDPAVINEGSALTTSSSGSKIVELVPRKHRTEPAVAATDTVTPLTDPTIQEAAAAPAGERATLPATVVTPAPSFESKQPEAKSSAPAVVEHTPAPIVAARPAPIAAKVAPRPVEAKGNPVYAQLMSTSDQKSAEALAAKLIDHGFPNGYVERVVSDKGTVFRVRVKFSTEAEARASVDKLKEFAKEVWIAKQ